MAVNENVTRLNDRVISPQDAILNVGQATIYSLAASELDVERNQLLNSERGLDPSVSTEEINETRERIVTDLRDNLPTIIPAMADFKACCDVLTDFTDKSGTVLFNNKGSVEKAIKAQPPEKQRDIYVATRYISDTYANLSGSLQSEEMRLTLSSICYAFGDFNSDAISAILSYYDTSELLGAGMEWTPEEAIQHRTEAGITDPKIDQRITAFARTIDPDNNIRLDYATYSEIPDAVLEHNTPETRKEIGRNDTETSMKDFLSTGADTRISELKEFLGDLYGRVEAAIDPEAVKDAVIEHKVAPQLIDKKGEEIRANEIENGTYEDHDSPDIDSVTADVQDIMDIPGISQTVLESLRQNPLSDEDKNAIRHAHIPSRVTTESQVYDWARTTFDFSADDLLSKGLKNEIRTATGEKGLDEFNGNVDKFVAALKSALVNIDDKDKRTDALEKAVVYGSRIEKQITELPNYDRLDKPNRRETSDPAVAKIENLGRLAFLDSTGKRLDSTVVAHDPMVYYALMKYAYSTHGMSKEEYKEKYGEEKPDPAVLICAKVLTPIFFVSTFFDLKAQSSAFLQSLYKGAVDYINRIEALKDEGKDTDKIERDEDRVETGKTGTETEVETDGKQDTEAQGTDAATSDGNADKPETEKPETDSDEQNADDVTADGNESDTDREQDDTDPVEATAAEDADNNTEADSNDESANDVTADGQETADIDSTEENQDIDDLSEEDSEDREEADTARSRSDESQDNTDAVSDTDNSSIEDTDTDIDRTEPKSDQEEQTDRDTSADERRDADDTDAMTRDESNDGQESDSRVSSENTVADNAERTESEGAERVENGTAADSQGQDNRAGRPDTAADRNTDAQDVLKGSMLVTVAIIKDDESCEFVADLKNRIGDDKYQELRSALRDYVEASKGSDTDKIQAARDKVIEVCKDAKIDLPIDKESRSTDSKVSRDESSVTSRGKGSVHYQKAMEALERIQELNGSNYSGSNTAFQSGRFDNRDMREAYQMIRFTWHYYRDRHSDDAKFDYVRPGMEAQYGRSVTGLSVVAAVINFVFCTDFWYTVGKMIYEALGDHYVDRVENSSYERLIDRYVSSNAEVRDVEAPEQRKDSVEKPDIQVKETRFTDNATNDTGTRKQYTKDGVEFKREDTLPHSSDKSVEKKTYLLNDNGKMELTKREYERTIDRNSGGPITIDQAMYYKLGSNGTELRAMRVTVSDTNRVTTTVYDNADQETDKRGHARFKYPDRTDRDQYSKYLKAEITKDRQTGEVTGRKLYADFNGSRLISREDRIENGVTTSRYYNDIGPDNKHLIVRVVKTENDTVIRDETYKYNDNGDLESRKDSVSGEFITVERQNGSVIEKVYTDEQKTELKETRVASRDRSGAHVEVTRNHGGNDTVEVYKVDIANRKTTEKIEVRSNGVLKESYVDSHTRDFVDGNRIFVRRVPDADNKLVENGFCTIDGDGRILHAEDKDGNTVYDRQDTVDKDKDPTEKPENEQDRVDGGTESTENAENAESAVEAQTTEQDKAQDDTENAENTENAVESQATEREEKKEGADTDGERKYDESGRLVEIHYPNVNGALGVGYEVSYDREGNAKLNQYEFVSRSDGTEKRYYNSGDEKYTEVTGKYGTDGKFTVERVSDCERIPGNYESRNLIKGTAYSVDASGNRTELYTFTRIDKQDGSPDSASREVEKRTYTDGTVEYKEIDKATGEEVSIDSENVDIPDDADIEQSVEDTVNDTDNADNDPEDIDRPEDAETGTEIDSEQDTEAEKDTGIETRTETETDGNVETSKTYRIDPDEPDNRVLISEEKITTDENGNKEHIERTYGDAFGGEYDHISAYTEKADGQIIDGGEKYVKEIDGQDVVFGEREDNIIRVFKENGEVDSERNIGDNGSIEHGESLAGEKRDIIDKTTGEKLYQIEYKTDNELSIRKYENGNLSENSVDVRFSDNGYFEGARINDVEKSESRPLIFADFRHIDSGNNPVDNFVETVDKVQGNVRETLDSKLEEYFNGGTFSELNEIYDSIKTEYGESLNVDYTPSDFAKDVIEYIADHPAETTDNAEAYEIEDKIIEISETIHENIEITETGDENADFRTGDYAGLIDDEHREKLSDMGVEENSDIYEESYASEAYVERTEYLDSSDTDAELHIEAIYGADRVMPAEIPNLSDISNDNVIGMGVRIDIENGHVTEESIKDIVAQISRVVDGEDLITNNIEVTEVKDENRIDTEKANDTEAVALASASAEIEEQQETENDSVEQEADSTELEDDIFSVNDDEFDID